MNEYEDNYEVVSQSKKPKTTKRKAKYTSNGNSYGNRANMGSTRRQAQPNSVGKFLLQEAWRATTRNGVKKRHLPIIAVVGILYGGYKGVAGISKLTYRGVKKVVPKGKSAALNLYRKQKESQDEVPKTVEDLKNYEEIKEKEQSNLNFDSYIETFAQDLKDYLETTVNLTTTKVSKDGKTLGVSINKQGLLCTEQGILTKEGKNYLQKGSNIVDTLIPLLNDFTERYEAQIIALVHFYFTKGMLEV